MTNRLTLATKGDLWNATGGYQDGGKLWCIRWEEDCRLDLRPEIEAWCSENLRHLYKVRFEPEQVAFGPAETSLVIEFEHPSDMFMFRATWGDP